MLFVMRSGNRARGQEEGLSSAVLYQRQRGALHLNDRQISLLMSQMAGEPDIVVKFDEQPFEMVFWRGTRFSPCFGTVRTTLPPLFLSRYWPMTPSRTTGTMTSPGTAFSS